MLNKKDVAVMEEAIRSVLSMRKRELRLSDAVLGFLAFDCPRNKAGKVQSIFKGQGSGENRKPQMLRIGDTINLCKALGLPWREVISLGLKAVRLSRNSRKKDSMREKMDGPEPVL